MALPQIPAYDLPISDLPTPRAPWKPDPKRAVLLVHDMQRYFVAPFGDDSPQMKQAVANISRLLAAARQLGIPVFYTAQKGNQYRPDRGLQADLWGPGMQQKPEHEDILPALAPAPGEHVLVKHRYSAFQRSNLEQLMRARGRDQIVITGIYAHIGCLATAVEAFQLDFQPFTIADAQADFTLDKQQAALQWIADCCGVPMTTADALKAFSIPEAVCG